MTKAAAPRSGLARRALGVAAVALSCAALAYQVLAHTVATALAPIRADVALRLNPSGTLAVLSHADQAMGLRATTERAGDGERPLSPLMQERVEALRRRGVPALVVAPDLGASEREAMRAALIAVLRAEPLNARAWRMLGQLEIEPERQSSLMRRAASRSLHDAMAVYWLLQDAILKDDYPQVVRNGDILMRSQPELQALVVPTMARIAAVPEGLAALRDLLKSVVPYRGIFFDALMKSPVDRRLPLTLFVDLQKAGVVVTTAEIDLYLRALINLGDYQLARYAWDQLAPPDRMEDQSFLFNGKFRFAPSGVPFDWTFLQRSGVRIGLDDAPGRAPERALHFEFIDGQAWGSVEQLLSLAPADYRLTGEVAGNMRGRRGMAWRLHCVETPGVTLAQTENLYGAGSWKPFALNFTIPAEGCAAQKLVADIDARSDSERLVSGALWFANLEIVVAP